MRFGNTSASIGNVSLVEVEAETSNITSLEAVSSSGGTTHALESAAESLRRLEFYLACSSEKLVNLDMLVMHVASRQNDFEAFASEEDDKANVHAEKALEFDILYGFLDSEVRELEVVFPILCSQEALLSFKRLNDATDKLEDRLHDFEGSLEQCFQRIADIKVQSATSQRMLQASSGVEKCKDENGDLGLDNADLQHLNVKIRMRNAELQKCILRRLEKSLAREIVLQAKIYQSRQVEKSLKLQLQQEVFCTGEEAEAAWQRLFEAENNAEILLMISKELFERLQMENESMNGSSKRAEELESKIQQLNKLFERQNDLGETEEGSKLQIQRKEVEAEDMWQRLFEAENSTAVLLMILKESFCKLQSNNRSMSGSSQRDDELPSKIQQLNKQLKEKACALQGSEKSRTELSVKVSLLEQKLGESVPQLQQLKDSLKQNKEFQEKASEAERRALIARAECKLIRESNAELHKEVHSLKSNIADASKRLERMHRLLRDSNIKRLHAKASAEANQEKLSMVECMFKDMDSLIKDLKWKVLKADRKTKSAEDKCIILSESNVEVIEELKFLKHRVQYLEKSLQQANESKKGTAKDIRVQSELIADFVMQLALERKRLRNQISSLVKEQKVAVMNLQQMKEPSVTMTAKNSANVDKSVLSKDDSKSASIRIKSNVEMMGGSSAASYEAGMMHKDMVGRGAIKTRIVDARHLHFKYVLLVVIVLGIQVMAAFLITRLIDHDANDI